MEEEKMAKESECKLSECIMRRYKPPVVEVSDLNDEDIIRASYGEDQEFDDGMNFPAHDFGEG